MEVLKQLRKQNKKSQQEIADFLGVNRGTYTNYELGKREPDFETLKKLAQYFNVSIDFLLGYTPMQTAQKNPSSSFNISPKEILHIKKYRALDERGRQAVDDTLDREYEFAKPKVEESAIS